MFIRLIKEPRNTKYKMNAFYFEKINYEEVNNETDLKTCYVAFKVFKIILQNMVECFSQLIIY